MKKFLVYSILFVLLAVAGCKPKTEKGEALKAEMGVFEKDWAATKEMINNWQIEMEETLRERRKDSTIARTDAGIAECGGIRVRFLDAMKEWYEEEKSYGEWKKQVNEGTLKADSAISKLKKSKAVLEKFNNLLPQWKEGLKPCKPTAYKNDFPTGVVLDLTTAIAKI